MSVPIDKKLWPLLIMEVMRKHASEGLERDENGQAYLTQAQILGFLMEDYGIKTQPRAILDNLNRLYEAGIVCPELGFSLDFIAEERRNSPRNVSKEKMQLVHKGWRLENRYDFDTSEIRTLIDSVIASSVIPPTQVKQLVRRLLDLAPDKISVPDIEREGHSPVVNNDFFWNIELLNEAIQQGKLVSFVLGSFAKDGKLHAERYDGAIKRFTVMPIQLLISKGHHYLLARFTKREDVIKFRIDRILELEVLEGSVPKSESPSKVNVVRFREQHSYMMSGELMNVVLRVHKNSLHTLFDQFGANIRFRNEQDETIDAQFRSALYSVLFWALQYYRYVEVIEPIELREKLEQAGSVIARMYAGEPGSVDFDARQD